MRNPGAVTIDPERNDRRAALEKSLEESSVAAPDVEDRARDPAKASSRRLDDRLMRPVHGCHRLEAVVRSVPRWQGRLFLNRVTQTPLETRGLRQQRQQRCTKG